MSVNRKKRTIKMSYSAFATRDKPQIEPDKRTITTNYLTKLDLNCDVKYLKIN
jgi:hypothetical protein